jgi:hypothetical protein
VDGALRRSGLSLSQIRGALAEFADIDFPIPVPRPRPYLDARDAFLYLLLFATLYTTAFHTRIGRSTIVATRSARRSRDPRTSRPRCPSRRFGRMPPDGSVSRLRRAASAGGPLR